MKKIGVILASLLIGFIVTVSCSTDKKNEDVIKIGAILPLTGNGSELSEYSKNGMLMAIEEINKNGGVSGKKLVPLIEDSKSNVKDGITALKSLISKHKDMKIVFSQLSGIGVALNQVTDNNNILHFSMSATPKFTASGKFSVRNYVSSHSIAVKASEKLNIKNLKNVCIVYMESEYSKPIAEELQTLIKSNTGIIESKVSYSATIDLTETRNLALKIIERSGKDGQIFLTGFGATLGNIAKELEVYGFKGELIVEPTFNLPENLNAVKEVNYPITMIDIDFPSKIMLPKQTKFIGDHIEKFKKEPKLSAALIYETIFLLENAIKNTESTDASKIINFIEGKKIKGEIFSSISISNRDIYFPLINKKIKKGIVVSE